MARIALFCSFVLLLAMSAVWTPRAQQPSEEARFTGKSVAVETPGMGVTRRRFEAGARTAWHSHPRGQLLLVEEGRARIQKRGQPFKDMRAGESDFTGPDIVHWHGAGPTEALVHVAVGFGGGETKWLEKVTDEEYLGKAK